MRKILLCVLRNWHEIIHYKLLPYKQTLNSDQLVQTIGRLKEAIGQKRPALPNRRGIIFHQDNLRLHTSIMMHQKLQEPGWDVRMLSPYSPDLAPSENYQSLSMAYNFSGEKFALKEACENRLSRFCRRAINHRTKRYIWYLS